MTTPAPGPSRILTARVRDQETARGRGTLAGRHGRAPVVMGYHLTTAQHGPVTTAPARRPAAGPRGLARRDTEGWDGAWHGPCSTPGH
jgi:hypothetical protein